MNVFIDPTFHDVYRRQPVVLVDVGARGGLREHWRPMQPHLRLVGFEPDPREFEALSRRPPDPSTVFLPTALHSERARLRLHIARDRGLTSIFEPNRPFLDTFPDAARFDTIDAQDVEADSLDALIRDHQLGPVDFIKVDTQGSELFVLQGAHATLERTLGVEVEVEFAPIYIGQPLFADVDRYLRSRGFSLFDLRPVYWKRAAGRAIGGPHGQIIWADALYLKDTPGVREVIAAASDGRAAALKGISIAVLYGYYDYALEISRASGGVLSPAEQATIERSLRADAGAAAASRRVPGRRRLAALLHRLWKRTAVRDDAWSVSDPELGNQR